MDQEDGVQFFFQLFSFLIKTKFVQNVNRMTERQKNRPTDRETDEQTDRMTDRKTKRLFSLVIKTKVVLQGFRQDFTLGSLEKCVIFTLPPY